MTHAPPIKRRCQCPPHVPTSSHNLPQPARQTSATTVVGMVEMVTARSKHRADALVWSLLAMLLASGHASHETVFRESDGRKKLKGQKGRRKRRKGTLRSRRRCRIRRPCPRSQMGRRHSNLYRTYTHPKISIPFHTHHPMPPPLPPSLRNEEKKLPAWPPSRTTDPLLLIASHWDL